MIHCPVHPQCIEVVVDLANFLENAFLIPSSLVRVGPSSSTTVDKGSSSNGGNKPGDQVASDEDASERRDCCKGMLKRAAVLLLTKADGLGVCLEEGKTRLLAK